MRLRSVLPAAVAALAVVALPASASVIPPVPQSPYCFTIDGEGVCIVLEVQAIGTNTPGDLTASITGTVGFYCVGTPHTIETACANLGAVAPIEVGPTGVVVNPIGVGTTHVTDIRVPEVCVPGGCFGPYYVPVDVPVVSGLPSVWIAGREVACDICG